MFLIWSRKLSPTPRACWVARHFEQTGPVKVTGSVESITFDAGYLTIVKKFQAAKADNELQEKTHDFLERVSWVIPVTFFCSPS